MCGCDCGCCCCPWLLLSCCSLSWAAVILRSTDVGVKASGVGEATCCGWDCLAGEVAPEGSRGMRTAPICGFIFTGEADVTPSLPPPFDDDRGSALDGGWLFG
uniref:Putative secreted protein n=1 Tax=Anopheles triannulatus TaxID=58253 RepID=A0A2M4B3P2_9DIPT